METRETAEVPDRVDHLIYGVPDLDRGIQEIERMLGVRPVAGGRHPEFGTRNALVALGRATYLEILAPDPDLPPPERGRLFEVGALDRPRLVTWALGSEQIEALARRARARGVGLGPVQSGSRETPDGTVLSWELTDPYALPMEGAVPFLIAWGDTPHPAESAPQAGELTGLGIEHPDPAGVREALSVLGADVPVRVGPRTRLVATIRTRSGRVELPR